MHPERRASPRQIIKLSLRLDDGRLATTRNMSQHGLYVEVPRGPALPARLSLRFAMPAERLEFIATGDIVRTEPGPFMTGVALRLHGRELLPLG